MRKARSIRMEHRAVVADDAKKNGALRRPIFDQCLKVSGPGLVDGNVPVIRCTILISAAHDSHRD